MAKTYNHLFDKALTFSALLEAHKKARRGKRFRSEVIRFEMDLEGNLLALARELKTGTYKPSGYDEFYVYEPKKRLIRAAPYRDRVVHQWYVINFIKPIYSPRFIFDSYACLDNKGMHKATERVQTFLRFAEKRSESPYIVKADVKKFFFNVDHATLFNILARKITDEKVLWLTKIILDSVDDPGIPVGSYTSQFFANVYLHELDMYIKHSLKIRMYVRYMDDFIMVVPDKEMAQEVLRNVREFVSDKLKLELNGKTQIFPVKNGVNFCGYKIKSTHMKIRTESKRRIKHKLRKFKVKFRQRRMKPEQIRMVLNSWMGYAKKADSYNLIHYILKNYTF